MIPESVEKAGFSKSLADADERIQAALPLVEAEFSVLYAGCHLRCDYTYRGPVLQLELFKKGREQDAEGNWVLVDRDLRVTDKDGTINKGPHNFYPSRAADVYVVETATGAILWPLPATNPLGPARAAMYIALGRLWEKHGLVSGATWKHPWKDEPHVQVQEA